MKNPFMDRVDRGGKGRQGRKAESLLVDRVGGVARIGSGNKEGAKGDVVLGEFLMENKTTTSKSLKMDLDWLLKIYQEALEIGKIPALSFQFVNDLGKSEKRERWVCIPEHIFTDIVERIEGTKDG